jgi:hypothetical protein
MKGEGRYRWGAAIADFYIFSIVGGVVPATYVAVVGEPVSPLSQLGLIVSIFGLVIVYHVALARRANIRTPGEILMGGVLVDDIKRWTNPFRVSRTALFAVIFVALIVAGNSWESAADERFYSSLTPGVVIGRVLILSGLVVGTAMAGSGRMKGGLLIVAYLGLYASGTYSSPPDGVAPEVTRGMAMSSLVLTIACALVVFRYHRALKPGDGTDAGGISS